VSTQRKIHHLLQSHGEGRDFQYLPDLRASFDLGEPILVTEKVDGSTMQSKQGEAWKRFDRFKKKDPRKRLASEEERYELRLCSPYDPGVKWYLASFNAHSSQFNLFGQRHPDRWIYFEALGAKVQSRYPGLDPTVRVFDVSSNGAFLPFSEAVSIAFELGLPVVAHRWETFGSLGNLLDSLTTDSSRDDGLPSHQLEGWVLRQSGSTPSEEVVAKVRIGDLRKLAR